MMWILLGLLALYVVFALLIDRGRDDQAPFDARESHPASPHTSVRFNNTGGGGDSSG